MNHASPRRPSALSSRVAVRAVATTFSSAAVVLVAALGLSSPAGPGATAHASPHAPSQSVETHGDVTCDPQDPTAEAVVDARMGWGVRESFRSYVTSRIAQGGWTTGGGTVFSDGEFVFAGEDGVVSVQGGDGDSEVAADAALVFTGSVNFTGHDGVLDTSVSDPEIRISGGVGTLVADVSSNDTDGRPRDYGRIDLATLAGAGGAVTDGILDGRADVTLTADGAEALGGFYDTGAGMDPLTFRAALAGGCDGGAPGLEAMPEDQGDGARPTDAQADGGVTLHDAEDGDDGSPVVAFLTTPATAVPAAVVVLALAVVAWVVVRRLSSR